MILIILLLCTYIKGDRYEFGIEPYQPYIIPYGISAGSILTVKLSCNVPISLQIFNPMISQLPFVTKTNIMVDNIVLTNYNNPKIHIFALIESSTDGYCDIDYAEQYTLCISECNKNNKIYTKDFFNHTTQIYIGAIVGILLLGLFIIVITNIMSITLSIILTNRKISNNKSINEIDDIIDTKAEQKQIDDELADVAI